MLLIPVDVVLLLVSKKILLFTTGLLQLLNAIFSLEVLSKTIKLLLNVSDAIKPEMVPLIWLLELEVLINKLWVMMLFPWFALAIVKRLMAPAKLTTVSKTLPCMIKLKGFEKLIKPILLFWINTFEIGPKLLSVMMSIANPEKLLFEPETPALLVNSIMEVMVACSPFANSGPCPMPLKWTSLSI